tara:strand:- start:183 stop:1493 length:1311 start_codon:yes stop_codon:yes gene_type:complete
MGYDKVHAMVAFSGEVEFAVSDPNAAGLLGEKFTETNMNPHLKGRDMRKAFESDDYQVMIVANKFQTGFDQPKLCAMYVDKKLAGVECVQTLSRLNRTYPGKEISGTFVLDFFNEPEDILAAFQEYYQTAALIDVSNPNLIFDLSEKLRAFDIFTWAEVERFCKAFLKKTLSNAAVANICKPAVERWTLRYKSATEAYKTALEMLNRAKKSGDAVLIANTDKTFKDCKKEKDALELFKKDLRTFVRLYEFISQIVDYDDKDLEKLSMYARQLGPLLREANIHDDELNLGDIALSHYRLSKIKQQNLKLATEASKGLEPGSGLGSGAAKENQEEFLSKIIERLNEIFAGDGLTEDDMIIYARTIKYKVSENMKVVTQIANNSREQVLLGDFPKAVEEAILESSEAHQKQMIKLLSMSEKLSQFQNTILDMFREDSWD